MESNLSYMHYL